jgi:hypothetical protein
MASTYLTRNTGGSGTSGTIATLSLWVKLSDITNFIGVFSASSNSTGSPFCLISRENTGEFRFSDYTNNTTVRAEKITSALARDVNGWYHIVIAIDTNQATASDRIKFYINGVLQTSFSTNTNYSLGATTSLGQNNEMVIGRYEPYNAGYWNGLVSHFHYTDGTAYDASTFGETDATTGIWKPKTQPSVTYGTNGFFLKFENSGSMGTDSSPNGNNFTVNGTMTQTVDTPSNVFATMNALNTSTSASLSYGNTKVSTTASGWYGSSSTLGFQKGFPAYWEAKCISSTRVYFGLSRLEDYDIITGNTTEGQSDLDYMWRLSSANEIYYRGSNVGATVSAVSTGDIISCKVDADGTVKFYKNDSLVHTFSTTLVDGYFYFPILSANAIGGGTEAMASNFGNGYFETTAVSSANSDAGGQGIFEYDTKSGYALNTKNINTYG